jgi:NAD(P)H-hydrate epimerase
VIDADGLNAFEGSPEALRVRQAPTLLTPHPGEAGRLLGCSAEEINLDRVAAARELAGRSGAVVLLKGPGSVVADPDGSAIINATGGSNLATGGSGDVLTGLVAALLAQGSGPMEAAALGAYVHGLAGDRIARRRGSSGLLAGELVEELPEAMQALREGEEGGTEPDGHGPSTLPGFP